MFVTNHVLSGVVLGRLLRGRPLTAFVVGVGSHLALDMVPHWGCDKSTSEGEELFLRYAKRDGVVGLSVMLSAAGAVDRRDRSATIAAMLGASILDADKPCLHYFGRNPFPGVVSRIHTRAQNESPDGLRNELVVGLLAAIADAFVVRSGRRHSQERTATAG